MRVVEAHAQLFRGNAESDAVCRAIAIVIVAGVIGESVEQKENIPDRDLRAHTTCEGLGVQTVDAVDIGHDRDQRYIGAEYHDAGTGHAYAPAKVYPGGERVIAATIDGYFDIIAHIDYRRAESRSQVP